MTLRGAIEFHRMSPNTQWRREEFASQQVSAHERFTMNIKNTKLCAAFTATLFMFTLSACSDGEIPEDAIQNTAMLDFENARIILPLDAFAMSQEDANLVEFARNIAIDECLVKRGVAEPTIVPVSAFREFTTQPLWPDWRYTHWNADFIAQYGILGPPAAPLPPELLETSSSVHSENYNVIFECGDEVRFETILRGSMTEEAFVLSTGYWESLEGARSDHRWSEAAAEWRECIMDKGLTVSPHYEFLVHTSSHDPDSEESRLAFVAAAQCADNLGTVSTLAALEAEFQAGFIAENFAVLNEIQRFGAETVTEARQFLSERGFL